MPATRILQHLFSISNHSGLAKYQQLIDHVLNGIASGEIKKGDVLPSINEVCSEFQLSRDTVIKAYNHLKERGVLSSIHGKGFYIKTNHVNRERNVFVLFDAFNAYKERLYDEMRKGVGDAVNLDIYFHHFKPLLFHHLLEQARGEYQYYVIMPFHHDLVRQAMLELNQQKLLMLDILMDYPCSQCSAVTQNFDGQLSKALNEALEKIAGYDHITFVFKPYMKHPREIVSTFFEFCQSNQLSYEVVPALKDEQIKRGHAYFVIEDDDLVRIVKYARQHHLKTGQDIGVLSYNDTPFKSIVEKGISVISTDFAEMGRQAAQIIVNPKIVKKVIPTQFISRHSL